jgi:hypothetical protein
MFNRTLQAGIPLLVRCSGASLARQRDRPAVRGPTIWFAASDRLAGLSPTSESAATRSPDSLSAHECFVAEAFPAL